MLKSKALMLSTAFALGLATVPALARVDVDLYVGARPPAARVEVIPEARPGYVWAPGFWRWEDGRHIWVDGYYQPARHGYRWVPDRWEEREHRHYFRPGRWERHRDGERG